MRTVKSPLLLSSLASFFLALNCTLITDVDRTKIEEPESGEGGSGGKGGS